MSHSELFACKIMPGSFVNNLSWFKMLAFSISFSISWCVGYFLKMFCRVSGCWTLHLLSFLVWCVLRKGAILRVQEIAWYTTDKTDVTLIKMAMKWELTLHRAVFRYPRSWTVKKMRRASSSRRGSRVREELAGIVEEESISSNDKYRLKSPYSD